MYGYIYITTNLINGKQYIGQHKSTKFDFNSYKGSGKILKKAFEKYGFENFTCRLLESQNNIPTICNTKEQLNKSEIYYIKLYQANNSDTFYNLKEGGKGGDTFSCQEVPHQTQLKSFRSSLKVNKGKKIINDGNKEKFVLKEDLDIYLKQGWILGRLSFSEEHKQKIGRKGRKLPIEARLKISQTHRGKSLSEEHKEKIRTTEKGKSKNLTVEQRNQISKRSHNLYINTFLIKKEGQVKRIPKEDLSLWENLGWKRGRYSYSKATIEAMRADRSNRVHIHKEGSRKMIRKEELQNYLQNGWQKGRGK